MALKIGTVSKLTGFSPSGIRYYEEKGIINPSHGSNGTYRSFDFQDVALLLECRNLRECGCSTTETVSAITTNDELESVKALRECGKRLRAEIQRKELLEGFLQQRICALESALGKTKTVQVRESPAFYWTPLWLPGKNENIEAAIPGEDSGFIIPFADSSLLLPQDVFDTNIATESKNARQPLATESIENSRQRRPNSAVSNSSQRSTLFIRKSKFKVISPLRQASWHLSLKPCANSI